MSFTIVFVNLLGQIAESLPSGREHNHPDVSTILCIQANQLN
jgi:hypothetical protein